MTREVWMMVTDDQYELPVILASNAQALADKAGTTKNNVVSLANKFRSGKIARSRFHRVKLDNE